jgi:hypothetical protein
MKTNNILLSVLTGLIIILSFSSCKEENPISHTDEYSVFFTLKFHSLILPENGVLVEKIIVDFIAMNSLSKPKLVVNDEIVDVPIIDSLNKKVYLSGIINIASQLNFKITSNGKSTSGFFIMPQPVTNVRCNGLFLTSVVGLPTNYGRGSIPTAEAYNFSWEGNGTSYYLYTHSGSYLGNSTSFRLITTGFNDSYIGISSIIGKNVQTGDKPNFVGSYGSGYVIAERKGSFFYNPNN